MPPRRRCGSPPENLDALIPPPPERWRPSRARPKVSERGRARWRWWALAVSALLHAALIVYLIIGWPLREMPPGADEKPIEIVYETSGESSAPPAPTPPAAAEPTPTPTEAPQPDAKPTPPAPSSAPAPATPRASPEPPPPAPDVAPEPAAPQRPPAPPEPPRVNLNLEPPPLQGSPELEVPQAPPPPPPRPRPAPIARAPRNEFTPFMRDYSFGGPPAAPPPGRAGRGIDLSLGAPSLRPSGRESAPRGDLRVVQGHATRDWGRELVAWVKEHAYYPRQAAENGEDGDVVVQVRADSTGKVLSVDLVGRSGSMWLDLALQAIFRRATIPPFTPEMTDPTITFEFTMHYILIR